MKHGFALRMKGDIYGGITAAVVALPLALAFGVASGLGPVAGLWGAIVVGFFASAFGGTPTQISGPTGPITVVVAAAITQFAGQPGAVFAAIMLAGLIQIGFGYLRVGQLVSLMPYPVISGFMSGIGFIIIILQLGPLIGQTAAPGGVLQTLMSLPDAYANINTDAAMVSAISLLIVFLWPKSLNRYLPGPLAALMLGTAIAIFMLTDAPVLGAIPTGLPNFVIPQIDVGVLPAIIQIALIIAALGAIDTLLTSLVADNLTKSEHHPDKELKGQGIGNLMAGLIGGLPGAGATMRTVVNIRAGGVSRLSGMVHAVLLLAIMLGAGGFAAHIPHAVLAGILIKVGIDIVDWDGLRQVARHPGEGTAFMLIVFGLTIFVDLITAVGVGVFLASILFVSRMRDVQLANIRELVDGDGEDELSETEANLLADSDRRIVLYRMTGPFSFGAAKGMVRKLTVANGYDVLVLDISGAVLLDSSAARALQDVCQRVTDSGRNVIIAGMDEHNRTLLQKMGFEQVFSLADCVESRQDAIRQAVT